MPPRGPTALLRAVAATAAVAPWVSACAPGLRASVAHAIEQGLPEQALEAYERLRASDGADGQLLGRISAVLLEREARGSDRARRRAAIQELALAGTAGEPILRALIRQGGPARIAALEALARRGDEAARRELRGLADDEDLDARAASLLAMDPIEDREALLVAIASPRANERERAAERLAGAAPDSDARRALENASRVDPEPAVRSASVRALGNFGPAAVAALRERLSDPVASVRMDAVAALLRADRSQARAILAALLDMPTNPQGIEAARLLATPAREQPAPDPGARIFLRQALLARDPGLRAQAAIALGSLPPNAEFERTLREALARESDPGARLALARALLQQPGGERDAREALRALATQGGSMPAVQAAATLAAHGDERGLAALAGFLRIADPALRRVAARALAREALRPDDARSALRDHDPSVRIAAAGAILAASVAT